jgi:hypothetical protein
MTAFIAMGAHAGQFENGCLHPTQPIPISFEAVGFGGKPEAADLEQGFRSAPKAVIRSTGTELSGAGTTHLLRTQQAMEKNEREFPSPTYCTTTGPYSYRTIVCN